MTPRALVLRAAGINCDEEVRVACEKAGFQAAVVHVNRLIERKGLIHEFHLLVVPGGFSYGDDLGAGRILGNELRAHLLPDLRKFIREGKLVFGVCNGFQILVRAGLLPDPFADGSPAVALAVNDSGKYEDRWVHLKVRSTKTPFLQREEMIRLPVGHGEGKFVPRDESVLRSLASNGQVVLTYVDAAGNEAGYPWNPNGSAGGVAGICDPSGRVLGMMPHPERFQDAVNHPEWTRVEGEIRPDGMLFFRNAAEYVTARWRIP